MSLEDKMEYLQEQTTGETNKYLNDLISAYYSLKYDLEELEEVYESYKEYSRPLSHMEIEGVPEIGPID